MLLESEEYKKIIVGYLKKLSDSGFITIYAFVIMPNHMHMIFREEKLNGKETPKASLLKYTAHVFLRQLKKNGMESIYGVNAANKSYEIWQRDSLAIEIYRRPVAVQKINYIHVNPVKGKWQLARDDVNYYYSSARYYETGIDDFGFLKNLYAEFDGN